MVVLGVLLTEAEDGQVLLIAENFLLKHLDCTATAVPPPSYA